VASERIAYTAYTQSCTFLLDSEGFCRRILVRGKQKNPSAARRCIGAQYVASLVLGNEGGLAEMPTVGAPLIFARIDEGRVSLVRTGPLERFLVHDDVEGREQELASLARTEERKAARPRGRSSPPPPEAIEGSEDDLEEADDVEDVVYHDAADRTQQLRHLHFEDDRTLMRKSSPPSKKKGMLPKRT
jgi:hypothetical protein